MFWTGTANSCQYTCFWTQYRGSHCSKWKGDLKQLYTTSATIFWYNFLCTFTLNDPLGSLSSVRVPEYGVISSCVNFCSRSLALLERCGFEIGKCKNNGFKVSFQRLFKNFIKKSWPFQDWQTIDDVMVLPDDDYYWGKIFITVVMFGLLVDSLGLAAVYVQYKVKSDLLIPMLAFYSLLVPATLAGTVRAAITIRFEFSFKLT